MKDKTGGPAFPVYPSKDQYVPSGMTLRDYFAAKAMQSLCKDKYYEVDRVEGMEAIAANAYDLADAMIAERTKS